MMKGGRCQPCQDAKCRNQGPRYDCLRHDLERTASKC